MLSVWPVTVMAPAEWDGAKVRRLALQARGRLAGLAVADVRGLYGTRAPNRPHGARLAAHEGQEACVPDPATISFRIDGASALGDLAFA